MSIASDKQMYAYHQAAQNWWNDLRTVTGQQMEQFNEKATVPEQLCFGDDPDEIKPRSFWVRKNDPPEPCSQVSFNTENHRESQYAVDVVDPDGNFRSFRLVSAEDGVGIVANENPRNFTLDEVVWLILAPLM